MVGDRADGAEPKPRALIDADRLAHLLGVPVSVFAYLEARVPGVRALAEGRQRSYRAKDAVLLAGLAELLYRDGKSFREVAELMGAGGRADIAARGRARLRGALNLDETVRPGARAIPADALVTRRNGEPEAPTAPEAVDVHAVLAELIDCVRVLDAAR